MAPNSTIDPEILNRFSLQDRVAIVTGSGKGIGKAIAAAFAQNGARVIIAEMDKEAGKAAAEEINADGGEALFIQSDVLDSAQVDRLMAETVKAFGRIDILVNNVGATRSTPRKPLLGIDIYAVGFVMLVLAAVMTIWSMVVYLRAAWPFIMADDPGPGD